jgi:choline dehydrogenase-like flavoprotein
VAFQILGGTPIGPVPASAHIMGTHRMAYDRDHGVCDPYGRYWAFDNLYHAGGGLFCTAPGYNVSATMWALSYRVAAAIVAGVGGRDSYTPAQVDADQPALERVIRRLDPDTMIARVLGG